jgi:enterochelin esterase-like enzyme
MPNGVPYDGSSYNNDLGPGAYPANITHGTYFSSVVNAVTGYCIYLPPEYGTNPNQTFDVIYFLTGQGFGSGATENSEVTTDPELIGNLQLIPPTIMVFPNPYQNSKYMDAAPGSSMSGIEMFESQFINELIPFIDANYRTRASQDGRAIMGFSGGGQGALRLAFKYPALFSSVEGMSGAVDDNASNVAVNEPQLLAAMFNGDANAFDVQTANGQAKADRANIIASGLAIHMSVGSADALLPDNQVLDALLTSLGISHDPLEVIPGGIHDPRTIFNIIGPTPFQFINAHFLETTAPTFQLSAFGPSAGGWSSEDTYPRELADVNGVIAGTGMADIVGFSSAGVYVSLATGGGHFAAPTFELAAFGTNAGGWSSDNTYPRKLADVSGDTRADIVAFSSAGVYESLATAGGHFAMPTFELAAFGVNAGGWSSDDTDPRKLADVNGDGRADIVGFSSAGVYESLATAGGHFATPTFELAAFGTIAGGWSSDNTYPRELADVNGDGRADIVGFGADGVYVSLATGGGHFAMPTFELAAFGTNAGGWSSQDLYPRTLADVNGDGKADIVGFGADGVYVSLATGGGHFASPTFQLSAFGANAGGWNSDNTYPRQLADISGDVKADIVGFAANGVWTAPLGFARSDPTLDLRRSD